LTIETVRTAVTAILDAHRAIAAAGFVVVDLSDGSFLWDRATTTMRLIDLDEYRPGPFTVPGERSLDPPAPWPRRSFAMGRTSTSGRPCSVSVEPSPHLLVRTDGGEHGIGRVEPRPTDR